MQTTAFEHAKEYMYDVLNDYVHIANYFMQKASYMQVKLIADTIVKQRNKKSNKQLLVALCSVYSSFTRSMLQDLHNCKF